jgi:tetratricopeptide (TPR) repeat protein
MKTLRLHTLATVAALALLWASAFNPAMAQLRPEIGKPLQQAGELLRGGKAREALGKVREAEAVGDRTGAEQLTIDRMKAAAAQRAGENGVALQALESIYGKVGGGEQGQIAEQIASAYAQQRNNGKASEWVQRAISAGNNSGSVRQLQSYLQSNSGDYATIGRDASAAISAAENAGRRPDEGDLLRLADAQQKTNNMNGYVATLEKLLFNYPKKDYWTAYLGRLPRKAGFSDRFALDLMRLRLASGNLSKTEDFMEMAQLSMQAGFPAEARRIADQGYKAGALGTGAEAARHQRLRDLAIKQETESKAQLPQQTTDAEGFKEGDGLVKLGYAYVTMGEQEKGIALIEKGIAKGNLKRPEDAKLRLGIAQMQSPKTKATGVQTLRSIKGTDGVAEIARMFAMIGPA